MIVLDDDRDTAEKVEAIDLGGPEPIERRAWGVHEGDVLVIDDRDWLVVAMRQHRSFVSATHGYELDLFSAGESKTVRVAWTATLVIKVDPSRVYDPQQAALDDHLEGIDEAKNEQ